MSHKIRTLTILVLLFLLGYTMSLQYFNNMYRHQLQQSNKLIGTLMYRDSIYREIVNVIESDTSSKIVRLIDAETNNVIKYSDLDSMYSFYYKQAAIKDAIIVQAKRKYKFNYSYKLQGDTIIIYFWDKSK